MNHLIEMAMQQTILPGLDPMVVLKSFIAISIAELGDKTQFAVILLASRGESTRAFLGGFTGFAFVNTLGILFGSSISSFVPFSVLEIGSSLIFLLLGALMLREEGEIEVKWSKPGLLASFYFVTSMELGDKTNLSSVAMAMGEHSPVSVLAGMLISSAFMMGLGSVLGSKMGKLLSSERTKLLSSLAFFSFGLYLLADALLS